MLPMIIGCQQAMLPQRAIAHAQRRVLGVTRAKIGSAEKALIVRVADERFHRFGIPLDGQNDRALFQPIGRYLATAGITCRQFGKLYRTVNVPSGRNRTGSPCSVTCASGSVAPKTINSASSSK